MRVIYIDVLLFLNFYVTYFLIEGSRVFLHKKIPAGRKMLGSAAGALSSLAIFLPEMPAALSLLMKLALSCVIVLSAMGFGGFKAFLRNTLVFFAVNCLYAGIMLGLWLFSAPLGMEYNNGVSYFDIPLWAILLFTAAAYLILSIIRRVLDSRSALDKKYELKITRGESTAVLSAIPDSGNKLTDFLTGLPVIFCDEEKCGDVCPKEIKCLMRNEGGQDAHIKGIRVVPCSTVSGSAAAYCFKPDKITISDGETEREINALVGFTRNAEKNGDWEAIFNPRLI